VAAALRDIVVEVVCKRGECGVDDGKGKETMRGKDPEPS
jgi:hypothetical protein